VVSITTDKNISGSPTPNLPRGGCSDCREIEEEVKKSLLIT
jgi:hypothetical protein